MKTLRGLKESSVFDHNHIKTPRRFPLLPLRLRVSSLLWKPDDLLFGDFHHSIAHTHTEKPFRRGVVVSDGFCHLHRHIDPRS